MSPWGLFLSKITPEKCSQIKPHLVSRVVAMGFVWNVCYVLTIPKTTNIATPTHLDYLKHDIKNGVKEYSHSMCNFFGCFGWPSRHHSLWRIERVDDQGQQGDQIQQKVKNESSNNKSGETKGDSKSRQLWHPISRIRSSLKQKRSY